MGGAESKRRIVVEDAGGNGIIAVTEAVVRRFKGLPEESYKDKTIMQSRPSPSPAPSPIHASASGNDKEECFAKEKDVEDFYLQKLKELQNRNAALQTQTNEQFAIAVKEVEQKFMNFTTSPVCEEFQNKVLQCYQVHHSAPLNCSPIVSTFTSCVQRARMTASRARLPRSVS